MSLWRSQLIFEYLMTHIQIYTEDRPSHDAPYTTVVCLSCCQQQQKEGKPNN